MQRDLKVRNGISWGTQTCGVMMRRSKANGKYRSAYRVTCEGGILPGTQEKNNSPEDPSLDSCPELESDGDEATQEN